MFITHTFVFITTILSFLSVIATCISHSGIIEDTLSKFAAIRCGAKDLVGMSKQQYLDRLCWIKNIIRFDIAAWSNRRSFERIVNTIETLKLDDSNGRIRRQPYCLLLTGFPGCGKSSFALQVAVACLRAKYGMAFPTDIVTLNETDEFQSEYRSSHKVVIFDDLGAEVMRPTSINPWRKVIDFVNNIRKTSLNPNVEMKGVVFINPDIVIITTNLASQGDFQLNHWCAAPSAIWRRLKRIIFLLNDFERAREFVQQPYEVDALKITYDAPVRLDTNTEIVSRDQMIASIVQDFIDHDKNQEDFVSSVNDIFDEVKTKSSFRAFFDDIIKPYWPTKYSLPKEMEKLLPWYERLYRYFCIKIEIPVCQTKTQRTSAAETLHKEFEGDDLDKMFEEHITIYKKRYYMAKNLDWDHYESVRREFLRTNDAQDIQTIYRQTPDMDKFRVATPGSGIIRFNCSLLDLEMSRTMREMICGSILNIDFSSVTSEHDEENSINTKSEEGNTSVTPKIPKIIIHSDIILEPDEFMDEFTHHIDRPLDPNMASVIDLIPTDLQLVGYETDFPNGTSDLIYRFIGQNIKYYLVFEIKSSQRLSIASKQAKKYALALSNGKGSRKQIYFASVSVNTTNVDWVVPSPVKKYIKDKNRLILLLTKFQNKYKGRCGATELSTES